MSCCDNSKIYITNRCGVQLKQTASSTSEGTLSPGGTYTVEPDGQLMWTAESSNGSDGKADGSLTFALGSSGVSMTFAYHFHPANAFGKCPCTASAANAITNGNYRASATTTSGSSDGTASVNWTVTTEWG